jgi:hypothetical protein
MSLRRLTLVLLPTVVAAAVLPSCFSSTDPHSGPGVMTPIDGGDEPAVVTADASPDVLSSEDAAAEAAPGVSPVIASFTVTPDVIPVGGPRMVTLTWSVTGASSLSIAGIGAVTGTSTVTSVSSATTFTLTATGPTGTPATATAIVTTAPGLYVDVTNGQDVAPGDGTAAHPYKTISKAGSVAVSGQTIYPLAGNYPLQTAGVHLADGVGIEAVTPGTVTLAPTSGDSYGLTFAGSGFAHGIALSSAYINVSAGTVNLDGVQFANVSDGGSANAAGINVSATGHVIVTPGALSSYTAAAVSSFAYVAGSGQLEIHGGALDNGGPNPADGSALISASGTARLLLDGVTIDSAKTSAIGLGGTPTVTLQNGTVINACAGTGGSHWSVNVNNGSPTIVIDASTIKASPGAGIYVNGGAAPSLTLRNGAVVETSSGPGIEYQALSATGTLTLDHAIISGNSGAGITMGSGTHTVTMRSTQIINNTGEGFDADPSPGSVIDLGTSASPGGNTFTGNAAAVAGSANVDFVTGLTAADLVINAIGNTWDPTANGADATGHFPAATTLSAPPIVSGKNVKLNQGGTATYFLKLIATP